MTTTGSGRGSLGFTVFVGFAVGFFVGCLVGMAVGVVLVGEGVDVADVDDVAVGEVALPFAGPVGVAGPHAVVPRASAPRARTVKACRVVPRGRAYRMVSPIRATRCHTA